MQSDICLRILFNVTFNAFPVGSCVPMTIPVCQTLDYNSTRMPNMFGHVTIEEAGLEANQFYPLLKVFSTLLTLCMPNTDTLCISKNPAGTQR